MKMKCHHGIKMHPLGEMCDNIWCQVQYRIRTEHANLSELPFLKRILLKWTAQEIECTETFGKDIGTFSQTYILVRDGEREYFKRFGTLNS